MNDVSNDLYASKYEESAPFIVFIAKRESACNKGA